MKPWKGSREGAVLAAYLGCWGCKTGQIGSMEELTFLATRIYELPDGLSPAEVGDRIEALGKKERRRLAYTNIPALFPEPDEVWPGDIPPRRGFRPPGAEPDRPGSIEGASPAVLSAMMKHSRPHLIDGEPFGVEGELDIDPAKLLRKVVSAIIAAGHASDLYEFPDVLAFFGARIPEAGP